MPFITPATPDVDGPWRATKTVVLEQIAGEPSTRRKTYFRLKQTFGFTFEESDGRNPGRRIYRRPPHPDLVAHVGDVTDLASVPPMLWGVIASYGRHTLPAILHDSLCDRAKKRGRGGYRLRRRADWLFRDTLRSEARMAIGTRWVMWAAVRLFGAVPLGITSAISILVTLGYLSPVFGRFSWGPLAIALTAVLALAFAIERSVEIGPVDEAPSPDESSLDGPARFDIRALGSLLGAFAVAVPAVVVLMAVFVVTLVTLWVKFVLNAVLEGVSRVVAILQGRLGRADEPSRRVFNPFPEWVVTPVRPGDGPAVALRSVQEGNRLCELSAEIVAPQPE